MFDISLITDNSLLVRTFKESIICADKKCPSIKGLNIYDSCKALEDDLKNGIFYNLYFIDTSLSDHIDSVIAIRQILKRSGIILIVQDGMIPEECFHYNIYDYFEQPINREIVCKVLNEYYTDHMDHHRTFSFTYKHHPMKIYTDNILFFESKERLIYIYTRDEVYKFYGKLSDIADYLKEWDFFRIHASFVINIKHLKGCWSDHVIMDNGLILPISQSYRKRSARLREFF